MSTDLISIYSINQIRQIEQLVYAEENLSEFDLMKRAGAASYQALKKYWPDAQNIMVFCGGGNNGGDGYVVALLAALDKKHVQIIQLGHNHNLKNPALQAQRECLAANINIIPYTNDITINADLIVDAIFGIGLNNTVEDVFAHAINKINSSDIPILAIDIASGLQADTGIVLGVAVRANVTITMLGLKLGLFTGSGAAYSGLVECASLEISPTLFSNISSSAECLSKKIISKYLPHRMKDAHKGHHGHVLIVGGDHGMPGAAHMAAQAAARVGAGLVSVATRAEHVTMINATQPEIMCHAIHEADDLNKLLNRATVIIIGPGLGRSTWSEQLFKKAVEVNKPMVIDADGLYWLGDYHLSNQNWIITPHPGEAALLLNTTIDAIQTNRLLAATLLQHQFGGVAVLKGSGTIICDNQSLPAVCPYGNPGMASGGMGDVLSGVIGGLLAQKLAPEFAAKLGVLVHALAGDLAAKEGERGLLATDLMPYLRKLVNPD